MRSHHITDILGCHGVAFMNFFAGILQQLGLSGQWNEGCSARDVRRVVLEVQADQCTPNEHQIPYQLHSFHDTQPLTTTSEAKQKVNKIT